MHRVGAFAALDKARPSRGRGTRDWKGLNRRGGISRENGRGEGAILCGGDRGAREQKNRRFFVQVNISARGPCLTGNALPDPSCTTKGSCCCCRRRCRCSRCGCGGSDCYRRETLRAVARSSLSEKKTTSFSAPPTTIVGCRGGRNRRRDYCVFQPIPSRCTGHRFAKPPSSVQGKEMTRSCSSDDYNVYTMGVNTFVYDKSWNNSKKCMRCAKCNRGPLYWQPKVNSINLSEATCLRNR